ncbi:MAG: hypothetical protein ACXWP4_21485, partial [Polyangiales bacterium]
MERQAPKASSQAKGAQSKGTRALSSQLLPEAEQNAAETPVDVPVQWEGLHCAPPVAEVQPPFPSQVPTHVPAFPHAFAWSMPKGSMVQWPGELGSTHVWQVPSHLESQHTP